MNDLTEVRGTNIAFEIRNGVKVEFANGDRAVRLRALGCPETIIKRVRQHRSGKRAVQPTEGLLALVNGLSPDAYRQRADFERTQRATAIGREIARQQDTDLRSRAARAGAIIREDAAKDKAENELRTRMENSAGIVCGRRSKADKSLGYPYEQAGEGVPETYPYKELAGAVATQLGHTLVGANGSQAFTKDRDGRKFTYSYSCDDAGRFTFGRQQMGGHPVWLGVGEKDVS